MTRIWFLPEEHNWLDVFHYELLEALNWALGKAPQRA